MFVLSFNSSLLESLEMQMRFITLAANFAKLLNINSLLMTIIKALFLLIWIKSFNTAYTR